MLTADLDTNKRLGQHGAEHVLQHSSGQPQTVITHCNAGSLATSGYGTALGNLGYKCISHVSHATLGKKWI